MRNDQMLWTGIVAIAALGPMALGGCGFESAVGNAPHTLYDRPASAIRGQLGYTGGKTSQLSAQASQI